MGLRQSLQWTRQSGKAETEGTHELYDGLVQRVEARVTFCAFLAAPRRGD